MNINTYKDLRSRFFEKVEKDTVSFLFSGVPIRKSADSTYVFESNRNFTYLTGIEEESALLIMDARNQSATIFVRDIDGLKEKWMGYFIQPEVVKVISGIEDVRFFSEFDAYLEEILKSDVKIGIDFDHDVISDDFVAGPLGLIDMVEDEERIVDIFPTLVANRMVKHPDEVEAIKHALKATDNAIMAALKDMKPGANENDLAARFQFEAMKQGGDLMFDTIMASGANAVVLHYVSNNAPLVDGELVLFDLGVRINRYGADISRTFPINGKFTDRQKMVYQAVLDCFHAVNKAARPGVSILDLQELAKEHLATSVKKMGLIERSEDILNYYYHGIGHSLGLDTHDVWSSRDVKMQAGNVITNEPGLYIKEWGIGIRIETDLLITEDGCEDLAPYIVREVEDIEKVLAK